MGAKGSPSSPSGKRDEELRKTLINLREQVIKDTRKELSNYIKGDDRQSVEEVLDTGDWSVFELSDTLKLKALESHRQIVIKFDESIRKLDDGTYGVCDDCDEEISPGRLKIIPFATRCRDCQENFEESDASEQGSTSFKL
ncbi:MAG: TraR/DksA family transcriptional regulator [Thermodesulfovibrionales bacterium]|nr:TraR/DksA family transcriptional regulator [Thermodesulfovibrionales bacterium]